MLGSVLKFMSQLIRPLRSIANGLGLAWWARIETTGPSIIYWFGPFIRRKGLERNLYSFLDDIKSEHPESLTYSVIRTRKMEPLTTSSGD